MSTVEQQAKLGGKYRPYPEYKDSGVEWIGKVPQSWAVTPVKRWLLESPCYGVLKPDKYDGEDAVPLIRIMDVNTDGTVASAEALEAISPSLSVEFRRTLIKKGDLIVSVVGTLGRSFICNDTLEGMNLSRALARLQVCNLPTTKYLQYVINSKVFEDYVGVTCTGAAQKVLNMEDVSNWSVPSPPDDYRSTIAAFLDYETARIDQLIAKQQQLIELLKEKRQAVISHAVTKGLNPHAPMKDSGVEWLGQVPKHWVVSSLRWYFQISSGEYISNQEFSLERSELYQFPVIGGNGVMGYTSKYNQKKPLVVGRVGALCGNVHSIEDKCWVTDNALLITINAKLTKKFSSHYLRNLNLNRLANQNTQPLITGSMIKDQLLIIPPIDEQLCIVDFINNKEVRYGLLIKKAETAISLMQERRTALISAAVTGKIDLRGWQPPKCEVAA